LEVERRHRCVNYMATYIPFDVIIAVIYSSTLLSTWTCSLMAKRPIVLPAPSNVLQPLALFLLCLGSDVVGAKREALGKRSLKVGTLLPNIVLYNDPTPHPSTTSTATLISADLSRKPDLLLIFGTTLKVHGIKKLVRDFAKQVHAKNGVVILVNKCELSKSEWGGVIDYWVEGDCDEWVGDLKMRIPNLWMKQEVLPAMRVVKPMGRPKKGNNHYQNILIEVKTAPVAVVDDKENVRPPTPKKEDVSTTYQTTLGLPSPLSPSKRGIANNAPESPTKRLATMKGFVHVAPAPKMQW